MLSALGLGGNKKRWQPAAKLQKDGKVSKKAMVEYLEYAASQIASIESVETVVQTKLAKKDEAAFVEIFNAWQMQLMEHKGYDNQFMRMSIDEWQTTAGTPGKPKSDTTVIEAFEKFENAIQVTMTVGTQQADIRESLQLRKDGEPEDDNSEALMPRRIPRTEGKLQTTGPVSRRKLITFCELARDLVLTLESRELLAKVLEDYSTWKQDKLGELCSKIVLRWQYELWESSNLAIDARLGLTELMRATPKPGEEEFLGAQQNMFLACQALTTWYTLKPHKDSLPRAEGRRYEAWSLADEAFKEERGGVLFNEGLLENAAQLLKCLEPVATTLGSDEFLQNVLDEAFAREPADLRADQRLMFELFEACGLEYRYASLLVMIYSADEGVQKYSEETVKAQKALKAKMAVGLRDRLKKKEAEKDTRDPEVKAAEAKIVEAEQKDGV